MSLVDLSSENIWPMTGDKHTLAIILLSNHLISFIVYFYNPSLTCGNIADEGLRLIYFGPIKPA